MVEMALSSLLLAGEASERMVAGALRTSDALTTARTVVTKTASARTEACARPEAAWRNAPDAKMALAAAPARVRADINAASAGEVRALKPALEAAEALAVSDCATFACASADERPESDEASAGVPRPAAIDRKAPIAARKAPAPCVPRA